MDTNELPAKHFAVMDLPALTSVSETLFLPLYALSIESRSKHPLIADVHAVALTNRLDAEFRTSGNPFLRRLAEGRLPKRMVTTVALRVRRYDAYVRDFLLREPNGVVVNLGCGLDTRRRRVDNGRMHWFDVDLPEVVRLREQVLEADPRFHLVASSVLDLAWLDRLPAAEGRRFLFVAEGLFMYLPPEGVRSLVVELRRRYPGSELIAELTDERIAAMTKSRFGRTKFRRSFGITGEVTFEFGVRDARDLEGWAPGIELLDRWSYFDEPDAKLAWLRPFGVVPFLRWAQFTARYRLGAA